MNTSIKPFNILRREKEISFVRRGGHGLFPELLTRSAFKKIILQLRVSKSTIPYSEVIFCLNTLLTTSKLHRQLERSDYEISMGSTSRLLGGVVMKFLENLGIWSKKTKTNPPLMGIPNFSFVIKNTPVVRFEAEGLSASHALTTAILAKKTLEEEITFSTKVAILRADILNFIKIMNMELENSSMWMYEDEKEIPAFDNNGVMCAFSNRLNRIKDGFDEYTSSLFSPNGLIFNRETLEALKQVYTGEELLRFILTGIKDNGGYEIDLKKPLHPQLPTVEMLEELLEPYYRIGKFGDKQILERFVDASSKEVKYRFREEVLSQDYVLKSGNCHKEKKTLIIAIPPSDHLSEIVSTVDDIVDYYRMKGGTQATKTNEISPRFSLRFLLPPLSIKDYRAIMSELYINRCAAKLIFRTSQLLKPEEKVTIGLDILFASLCGQAALTDNNITESELTLVDNRQYASFPHMNGAGVICGIGKGNNLNFISADLAETLYPDIVNFNIDTLCNEFKNVIKIV